MVEIIKYEDVFAAVSGQEQIGKVIYWKNQSGREIYIKHIIVEPEYQRKGIGTRLLNCLEKIGKSNRYVSIYTITQKINIKARNFYKKNGYVKTGEIKNLYGFKNKDENDAVVYLKKI